MLKSMTGFGSGSFFGVPSLYLDRQTLQVSALWQFCPLIIIGRECHYFSIRLSPVTFSMSQQNRYVLLEESQIFWPQLFWWNIKERIITEVQVRLPRTLSDSLPPLLRYGISCIGITEYHNYNIEFDAWKSSFKTVKSSLKTGEWCPDF